MWDIAAYFASKEVMKGVRRGGFKFRKGKITYKGEYCDRCHGMTGKLDSSLSSPPPVIGGQHSEYLVRALWDIKSGERSADIYGLMVKALNRMSDEEIEAVAVYLSTL
jgi:cytochrome c553